MWALYVNMLTDLCVRHAANEWTIALLDGLSNVNLATWNKVANAINM